VVEAVHLDQIRGHGGLSGLRDEDSLEAALARPKHKWAYRRKPDLAMLAAAYLFGIARHHPFRDGNKRVAFLTAMIFLELNDVRFETDEVEVVSIVEAVAAGKTTEGAVAKWMRERITEL